MVEHQESITAKLCSFARAFHSNFSREKIFDDYLSFDLMGKSQYEEIGQLIENNFDVTKKDERKWFCHKNIRQSLYKYILPIPLSRICFAENELKKFAQQNSGQKIQYVICGAGMDSFAFRNENESIRIFEIDHPDSQRYKLERIKKLEWNIPSNLKFISMDFSKDSLEEKLLEGGFDVNAPVFTAILGVSYYLTLPVFEETLKIISGMTVSKSRIIFDFPDETTFNSEGIKFSRVGELARITEKLGEPMLHGFSFGEIKASLERHGLRIVKHETPTVIQKKYFSNRSDGLKAYENVHFIVAEKI
ncbi:SAM-dependent methyltransferase [Treponema sp.]|uniref:class I SAM-dependent methyltransferase n=1 Tax=Treponema sp. TaxID=166 RepID=UPI00257AD7D1|nr:SAM-dependent methyltransferase [Treponema sp.]MBE6354931.1 class I SAM-dependent methyltransferase [Treponema sp.]